MDRSRRKTLYALAALGLGYVGFRALPGRFEDPLVLEEMDSPAGFRRFRAGQTSSAGFDPFVGLEARDDAAERRAAAADARVQGAVCETLFAGLERSAGVVPMASFSDYYCPYCRVQTRQLAALEAASNGRIAIAWHELPLFGEASEAAARAALAAKRQNAYAPFHERLMRSNFQATPGFLTRLARDIEVDAARLIADMDSPAITRELEDSAALARLFAFVGTPALVIGRTVVQGQVSDRTIQRLLALEREDERTKICST